MPIVKYYTAQGCLAQGIAVPRKYILLKSKASMESIGHLIKISVEQRFLVKVVDTLIMMPYSSCLQVRTGIQQKITCDSMKRMFCFQEKARYLY